MRNGEIGYWMAQPDLDWPTAPSVDGDESVDVAIIGGGLTGLWTAWAIKQLDPHASVHVYEAEQLGYGASGRNGGWLSSKQIGLRSVLANGAGGRAGVVAMNERQKRAVYEVVDLLGADTIHARRGGALQVARSPSELARLRAYIDKSRQWSVPEEDLRLLSAEETSERVNMTRLVGGMYSPHCFTVDPARMVASLARLARDAGVELRSSARATAIQSGTFMVGGHTIRAGWTVIATEGYTALQPNQRRAMLPMNSSMLITEPIAPADWKRIGWSEHEGVSSTAHTYFYGRPTVDGRIAIGGRGTPYNFAGSFDRPGRVDGKTIEALQATLDDLFPDVSMTPAHAWSGVLGILRDWSPYVDADEEAGVLRVGGYAGQGVTGAYLGGQIAAELVLSRRTELSDSPWVRPLPSKWEPEPLRWIGANALYSVYGWADRLERHRNDSRTSALATIADKFARRG